MRSQQFVHELAPKIGIDEAEVSKFDRYLANAGMRRKAEGRSYPDLSAQEALRLPLAIAAARTPSEAVAKVEDLSRYRLCPGGLTMHVGTEEALCEVVGQIEDCKFLDVLATVVRRLAAPYGAQLKTSVWVKVELGGPVLLQIEGDAFACEMQFTGATDNDTSREFLRTITIGSHVLCWIGFLSHEADK